jgi:hypothetical protein
LTFADLDPLSCAATLETDGGGSEDRVRVRTDINARSKADLHIHAQCT